MIGVFSRLCDTCWLSLSVAGMDSTYLCGVGMCVGDWCGVGLYNGHLWGGVSLVCVRV